MTDRYDVVVVGGGQAGLAIGYFLAQQGRRFVILEAADMVAPAWRDRWDSLRLFTPVRNDSLPGMAFPGDPDSYPGRDDVLRYLTGYARHFELPVELDRRVTAVLPQEDGGFRVESGSRAYDADQVVIATGSFQEPRVPPIAAGLDPGVVQLHSTGYRHPGQIPAGTVLVVGGGNTGFQIAEELARDHAVHLSIGARQTPLPQRIAGRDLFGYLEALGVMRVKASSRLGQKLQQRDTLIGSGPIAARRRHGIRMRKRAVEVDGREVVFADGTRLARRGDLGHGLRARSRVRQGTGVRRRRPRRPSARRHERAGAVLPRPAVAVHAGLRAAGLDQGRRRVIAGRIAARADAGPAAEREPPIARRAPTPGGAAVKG